MESNTQQEGCMSNAQPQEEHRWLQKIAGEWTYEGHATMVPGQPPESFKGVETVRSIGGLWMVAEGKGETPGGGEATMIMTLGFDAHKKRFVGTFIASMMTHMWVYDGELDAAGKVLTLNTEGPNMAVEDKMATYKDVIEIESDDRRVMTSHLLGDDGKWTQIMTSVYRRRKS